MPINEARKESDGRLAALRELILHSFPDETYTGKVTPNDGAWLPELTEENAILDDDKFLYEALKGRKRTEVPTSFIYGQPDGLALLTDEAFVSFLPAWLLCSLENIDGQNEVRNFVVYTFSPRHDLIPDMTWFKTNRIRILNPQQRLSVRSLLAEFVEREASSYLRKHASHAIALIDNLG
jgi:hypothetical protein